VRTEAELRAGTPRADPLVLIHGIGIGPSTYVHLLKPLMCVESDESCVQRSVYALELPYISMRIGPSVDDVPQPQEHVVGMVEMLHRHEMDEREFVFKAMERLRRDDEGMDNGFYGAASSPPSSPTRRLTMDEVQQSDDPIKILLVGHSYGSFVSTQVHEHTAQI
jgi:pimeloyl-ACP methyl ester carboxylesterase